MNKKLKWTLIVLASLALVLGLVFKFMQYETKKASPEATVTYKKDGKQLSVLYCRPFKKNRVIFGLLVPYDKVWRTGANEATTFSTDTAINIDGQLLPAGIYTLWTIPGKENWTVIFNSKHYGWGITYGGEASREPEYDALKVKVPVQHIPETVEQFTISFDDTDTLELVLEWDMTRVAVPIK
ncbi:MAG: hypothetical protein K0R51_2009 [Cytophagaceae bacterium]|jgi:hypothetical protein|nr:hypothetical protein [Cytophagaceae bacterium]